MRSPRAASPLQSTPTLRIDPAVARVAPDGTTTLSILLDGDAQVQGFDVALTLDPREVQVVGGVQPGALLASADVQELTGTVDNDAGRVSYAAVVRGPAGVTGPGTIASFTVRAVGSDRSHIVLSPLTELVDRDGRPVPVALASGLVLIGDVPVTPEPTLTALPEPTPPAGAVGIWGNLTFGGQPVADVEVGLYRSSATAFEAVAVALTSASGRYGFASVPTLGPESLYVVGYVNADGSADRLEVAVGKLIESYASGALRHGGDIDVRNVALGGPNGVDRRRLPVSFTWATRGVMGDRYLLHLFGADNRPDVGVYPEWTDYTGVTGGRRVVASPLPGFEPDKPYFWDVYVYRDGTLGLSNQTYRVAFDAASARHAAFTPFTLNRAAVGRR
jgi:hypothetical protein